jgi:23S rRNA (uracil1939-C5)-methyltransferase
MRLIIESIGAKGDGVATHDGNPVFVDGALMGEEVEVAFLPPKGGVCRAKLLNVLTPSPLRQMPPCKHYGVCGGCALQHMNAETYQSWKFDQVKAALSRKQVEPRDWLSPVFIGSHVRRRATFSYLKQGKNFVFGYHKKRSNQILKVIECHLVLPEIMNIKNVLERFFSPFVADRGQGTVFIQKLDNGYDVTWTGALGKKGEPDLPVLEAIADIVKKTNIIRFSWRLDEKQGPQTMLETQKPMIIFGDLRVPIAPLAFLQPSVDGQNALVNAVRFFVPGGVKRMADLFSGAGTFTGGILDKCAHIDAYESGVDAVQSLKAAGYKNAFKRDLFRDPLNEKELSIYDAVVIDPPRAGAMEQMKMLANSNVKNVISVSCNPSTFARDAHILIGGGYVLDKLQMVDQFVWSDHAELVGLFVKK